MIYRMGVHFLPGKGSVKLSIIYFITFICIGHNVETLSIGAKVPGFSVASTKGVFNLNDHIGSYLVLYFYPKDSTPGCTREGQDFRDLFPEFTKLNAQIFGISRDSLKSHANFKEKQQFPFELLADTEQTVCRLFNVLDEASSDNKDTCSMIRTTF